MKKAVVFGAGGFIGSHLVERLKKEGYWVRGVDLKKPEFSPTVADEFIVRDLRNLATVIDALRLENVTSINPLYGLVGYTVIKNTDAKTIIKDANTTSYIEFKFSLGVNNE